MDNRKKPYVTIALVVINVLVFFIMDSLGDTEDSIFMLAHGAMFPDYIINGQQYYRLFTANYLHFGFPHLLNNMVVLVASATILEEAAGHVKFAIIYVLSGIGGSILSLIMMLVQDDIAVAAGASGAVFGCMGGLLWVVIRNKGRYERLSGKGMLVMIGLSIYYGLSSSGVDNWGHVGGLITGFVMTLILYRKRPSNHRPSNVEFYDENQYT